MLFDGLYIATIARKIRKKNINFTALIPEKCFCPTMTIADLFIAFYHPFQMEPLHLRLQLIRQTQQCVITSFYNFLICPCGGNDTAADKNDAIM